MNQPWKIRIPFRGPYGPRSHHCEICPHASRFKEFLSLPVISVVQVDPWPEPVTIIANSNQIEASLYFMFIASVFNPIRIKKSSTRIAISDPYRDSCQISYGR
jgi:hypothetical protein